MPMWQQRLLWASLFVLSSSVYGADDNRSLSLVDNNLTLDVRQDHGPRIFYIKANNWPSADLGDKSPEVKDLGEPVVPDIRLTVEKYGDKDGAKDARFGDAPGFWRYKLNFESLPPDSLLKRRFEVVFGDRSFILDYLLNNQPAVPFSWAVKSPLSPWNTGITKVVELPILTDTSPATRVRLLQSTLLGQDADKTPLGISSLQLCRDAKGMDCPEEITLPAHNNQSLYIRLGDSFSRNGTFQGNLTVSCAEKPGGDSFSITVYHSSDCARFWGIAAVLLGVLTLFLAAVVARWRINRNNELLPSALLAVQAGAILKELNAAVPGGLFRPGKEQELGDKTRNALNGFEGETERKLTPYLTPIVPNAAAAEQQRLDNYKAIVQQQSQKLEVLRVIVEKGFVEVRKRWDALNSAGTPAEDKIKKFEEATAQVNLLCNANKNLADTTADINSILTALDKAVQTTAFAGAAPEVPTPLERLSISTSRWSWLVWLVWIAVTVFAGAVALVFSDPGFGVCLDYAKCFLWGLGLPLAGQQLTQLTGTSVGSSIGVTIPKAS